MKSGFVLPAVILVSLVGLSVLGASLGWSTVSRDGSPIAVESLLGQANVGYILANAATIATSFPPFGTILLVSAGASLTLTSGLLEDIGDRIAQVVPSILVSPTVFGLGLIAHQLSDALLIVYIPLAGLIFAKKGRSPVVGIILGFAAFSGALYASFAPGLQDLVLMSLTSSATAADGSAIPFNPLANWWFSSASAIVFLAGAWAVTDLIVERRWADTLPPPAGIEAEQAPAMRGRGRTAAALAGLAVIVAFTLLIALPGYAPLRDRTAMGLAAFQPAMSAGAAMLTVFLAATGASYALATGRWRKVEDLGPAMRLGVGQMAPFFLMAIAIGFLTTLIDRSGLGAVAVAALTASLREVEVARPWLLMSLAAITAALDFVAFSASAKWAIMAPTVIPAFDALGLSPALTTAAFRLGDSAANILNPVQPAAVIAFLAIRSWTGSLDLRRALTSLALYAGLFLSAGMILLILWETAGWPPGPFA